MINGFQPYVILKNSLLTIEKAMGVVSTNMAMKEDSSRPKNTVYMNTQTVVCQAYNLSLTVKSLGQNDPRFNDLGDQHGNVRYQDILCDYLKGLEHELGQKIPENTLIHTLTDVVNALGNVEANPTYENKELVRLTLDKHIHQLNRIATYLNNLKDKTDGDIQNMIPTIPDLLDKIADANRSHGDCHCGCDDIEELSKTGMMRSLIHELSGYMDIDVKYHDDGMVSIFTKSGVPLVDRQISYPISFHSSDGKVYVGDIDITSDLKSGALKALLDLKNTILPGFLQELDTYSQYLGHHFNGINIANRIKDGDNAIVPARMFKNINSAMTIAIDTTYVGHAFEYICHERDTRPIHEMIDVLNYKQYDFPKSLLHDARKTTLRDYMTIWLSHVFTTIKNAKDDQVADKQAYDGLSNDLSQQFKTDYEQEMMRYQELFQTRKFLLDTLKMMKQMQEALSNLM